MGKVDKLNKKEIKQAEKIIDNFSKVKVLVLGDIMWDEYLLGNCERISPEAPVPVVKITNEKKIPGGASNVLRNLISLGVSSGIMGVVGNDSKGLSLQDELNRWGLNSIHIWEVNNRPTTVKTRVITRNQQMIRLDREEASPIDTTIEQEIIHILSQQIPKFDAIILSDYDKGFLTKNLIQKTIQIAKSNNIYIAVDPKPQNFFLYQSIDLLTPNEKEAANAAQMPAPISKKEIQKIADIIKNKLIVKNLLITRSQNGMVLFVDKRETKLYTYNSKRNI